MVGCTRTNLGGTGDSFGEYLCVDNTNFAQYGPRLLFLILGFYFTSKILLVKPVLLVKLEQHSKKRLRVRMSPTPKYNEVRLITSYLYNLHSYLQTSLILYDLCKTVK